MFFNVDTWQCINDQQALHVSPLWYNNVQVTVTKKKKKTEKERKLVLEPRTYCKIQGSDKEMQPLKNAEAW